MDFPTALAVIGIIISLLFGVWGIIIALRCRYPGQITFLIEDTMALFETIVKHIPDISILYKNIPIKHNVVMLNGTFINSGRLDISKSMVEKPITISLPISFKWLAANVKSSSDSVMANVSLIDDMNLSITSNLFRCGEFIRIQALAEIPIEKNLKDYNKANIEDIFNKNMTLSHRISGVGNIDEIDNLPSYRKKVWKPAVLIGMGIILLAAFLINVNMRGGLKEFVYKYKGDNNTVINVIATPASNNFVVVESTDDNIFRGSYFRTIPIKLFYERTIGYDIRNKKGILHLFYTIIILYIVVPSVYCIWIYIGYRKHDKIKSMLYSD